MTSDRQYPVTLSTKSSQGRLCLAQYLPSPINQSYDKGLGSGWTELGFMQILEEESGHAR